jgi:predicted TIM-barrel fold metal-dependent hydrolase
VYADDLLAPWHEQVMRLLPPLSLFDAHTHIGANDPDGFTCAPHELLAALAPTSSRAVVFPMHEPDGYRTANDEVISVAAQSDGRLVAFCRVNPHDDPATEVRRCLAAGARGIKLHPRAERFVMLEPSVREIVAIADEEHVPVLIHAGRGIPALGAHVLELAREYPRARFILAHAGVSDLAWIWKQIPEHPNVYFDTSWYSAADLRALFALVPPGQVLYATDLPYGTPAQTMVVVFRNALQAGLSAEQIRSVAGAQLERLIDRDDALDFGPAPGAAPLHNDPLLDRVHYYLVCAFATLVAGSEPTEFLELTRLACQVGDDAPQAAICRSVVDLLDIAGELDRGLTLPELLPRIHLIVVAATLAVTPDVPVG